MRTSKPNLRPAARRSRTKTRKPKFMSLLRIDLSNTTAEMSDHSRRHGGGQSGRQHPQLNLFPLQPETADSLVDDTRDDENININLLFNGDDTSATTLSCLLDGGDAITPARASDVACSEEGYVGSRGDSLRGLRDGTDYGGTDHQRRSSLLVRAAMKSVGRVGEERWVSYSELVERKPLPDLETEEVSSCSAAANSEDWGPWQLRKEVERSSEGLLLKLDYDEVLNSWSDKGSLFINGRGGPPPLQHHEDAQIVPEINSELLGPDSAIHNGVSDRWGNATVWTVPDHHNSTLEEKEGRFRQREASVLRYKEKRQNRLFAKRIRYEVRKLNAEKRPRIKGRFVRRGREAD